MDTAGHVLLAANDLYARAGNTTSSTTAAPSKPSSYKIIGLVLALTSGLFIGVSFVLKKTGLLKANAKYNEEAGEGYGYLKNLYWWCGMTLMIIGEICNFAAYLFADAVLVTPMGALSVVVCAILSAIFLKERLSFVGKIGCFNCIVGATVIALNAPEQGAVNTIQDMEHMVLAKGFLIFGGIIIVGCVCVAFFVAPKYGKKSMLVYLTVCSLIGGLSVVGIQGIGAAITAQARGIPQFNQWFLYVLLTFIIVTLVTEIIYLNKALNIYNAALVTPTYYVYFTSAVIVTSAVLFQGFKGTPIEIITVVMGFLQICSGVVLLQLSKSAKDVPDTAVFSGDLDQVRTVAEQEEPEYEPRADTIRGGGAILRSISKVRQSKQMQEIERLRDEHLHPIGENEPVEFDGLRRRRTILAPGQFPSSPASISRRKTLHPPLGMSHFPTEDELADEDMHPGMFHWPKARDRSSTATDSTAAMPLSPMKSSSGTTITRVESTAQGHDPSAPHTYGLPAGLHDTSYRGSSFAGQGSTPHIQFADPRSGNQTLTPPPPVPPHKDGGQRRQFSFQNVFHHHRPGSRNGAASPSALRPVSRGALSFGRSTSTRTGGGGGDDGTTEEERLGLVKGDSQTFESPPSYSSSAASEEELGGYDDETLPSGREVEARKRERERRRPARIDAERANRSGSGSEVERLPSAKRLGRGSGSSEGSAGAGGVGGGGGAYV